jgi:uncharacterized protein YbjT (DUF2867 family)
MKVPVTGATGFLGGDLTLAGTVHHAVRGCDAVVHTAAKLDSGRPVALGDHVLAACRRALSQIFPVRMSGMAGLSRLWF